MPQSCPHTLSTSIARMAAARSCMSLQLKRLAQSAHSAGIALRLKVLSHLRSGRKSQRTRERVPLQETDFAEPRVDHGNLYFDVPPPLGFDVDRLVADVHDAAPDVRIRPCHIVADRDGIVRTEEATFVPLVVSHNDSVAPLAKVIEMFPRGEQ